MRDVTGNDTYITRDIRGLRQSILTFFQHDRIKRTLLFIYFQALEALEISCASSKSKYNLALEFVTIFRSTIQRQLFYCILMKYTHS